MSYRFALADIFKAGCDLDAEARSGSGYEEGLGLENLLAEGKALSAPTEEERAYWTAVFNVLVSPERYRSEWIYIGDEDIMRRPAGDHGDDAVPY